MTIADAFCYYCQFPRTDSSLEDVFNLAVFKKKGKNYLKFKYIVAAAQYANLHGLTASSILDTLVYAVLLFLEV
jgi:hypothetical protein